MHFSDYARYISAETLMGPNSVRILEELFRKYPLQLAAEDQVLDLGCGTGLTSLVIAKETGAKVCANDLWIGAEENARRFKDWGVGQQVTPSCEDANDLSFDKKQFQALVSVDSYHYFAGEPGFFENKILPFLNNKAEVLIGVPGIKDTFEGRSDELLSAWLGDESYMFKSPKLWKEIIGSHGSLEKVETWEMECFDNAWSEWFATNHEYALGDKRYFETMIKPYTCFVGIYVKIR
ncbi:MAG: methyltransferase domain-containing protein [Clostridiales bacterium]|nr:methyltransferase domain-containing protein [Clostridiales bacterium]